MARHGKQGTIVLRGEKLQTLLSLVIEWHNVIIFTEKFGVGCFHGAQVLEDGGHVVGASDALEEESTFGTLHKLGFDVFFQVS